MRTWPFSPDDGLLAVAVKNGVVLWRAPAQRRRDLAPFARLRRFGGFTRRNTTCLAWSADATLLACGSEDNSVRVFRVELDEDERIKTLRPRRAQGCDSEVLLRRLNDSVLRAGLRRGLLGA